MDDLLLAGCRINLRHARTYCSCAALRALRGLARLMYRGGEGGCALFFLGALLPCSTADILQVYNSKLLLRSNCYCIREAQL